jgi:two-component system chemotaxis response regulator CheY
MPEIIVVDDDTTNVQLLQMLLELEGFAVTACTNIEQATAAATPSTRAFVIDWHLERNTSGLELLNAVRQGQTKAAADTILIISSGDHRREKEALAAGANHFLLKPYPPDELLQLLAQLLPGGKR